MAAYRFSVKVIKRSEGRSATAAAAYRAGVMIEDERTGLTHDYTRRKGVTHSEIMLPDNAPAWMQERGALWNAAEQAERRKDAQLSREIQMNLPHELDDQTRLELARAFVRDECVSRGMAADINIHAPDAEGDNRNHHAHVMLTLRVIDGDGFGKKERDWNDRDLLEHWRERWAYYQNEELEKAGLDVRVDHRTLEAQGIDREPEPKLGAVATQMERDGVESHAGNDLRAVWKRNAERALQADQAELIDLRIAQERAREIEQAHAERRRFDGLYEMQRLTLEQERERHQQQINELSSKLEDRSRFAVLWDKVRGRLGWRAEEELEAARTALQENEERANALEISRMMQETREYEAQQDDGQHIDEAYQESLDRDAFWKNENKKKLLTSLEEWEASDRMQQGAEDAAICQARGITIEQLIAEEKAAREQPPENPYLNPENERIAREAAEHAEYVEMFRAAREEAQNSLEAEQDDEMDMS